MRNHNFKFCFGVLQIFDGIFRCYAVAFAIFVVVVETEWGYIMKFWKVRIVIFLGIICNICDDNRSCLLFMHQIQISLPLLNSQLSIFIAVSKVLLYSYYLFLLFNVDMIEIGSSIKPVTENLQRIRNLHGMQIYGVKDSKIN